MSISTETKYYYKNSILCNSNSISCSFEYDEQNNKFILLPYEEGSNKINENYWKFYSEFYIKDKKTPIMNFMDKNFVKENLYKNLNLEYSNIDFLNYRFKEYNGTVFNKEELFSLYKDFLFDYHLKNTYL